MNLPRISSLLFNAPHLIRHDAAQQIANAVAPRLISGDPITRGELERPAREASTGGGRRLSGGAYLTADGIAVWPIVGTLVRRGSWLDAECGLMSYDLIQSAAVDIFMNPQVRGVLIELDTPGGEAAGCFDTAELLRNLAKSSGKPLWAHANEEACSAGYALASAGSKIWAARTAMVGSIGVVCAHMDRSKADEIAGLKWTIIKAGEYKADGNPHEPLDPGALARVQGDIDDLMGMFADLIAKHRGVSAEKVRGTKAAIYRGKAAVKAGLADKVGTLEEALAALGAEIAAKSPTLPTAGGTSRLQNSTAMASRADGDALQPASLHRTPSPEEVAVAARNIAVPVETLRRQGLTSLAASARRLGGAFDLDAAVRSGVSVEEARHSVLNAMAAESEKTEIFAGSSFSRAEGAKAKKNAADTWASAYRNLRS